MNTATSAQHRSTAGAAPAAAPLRLVESGADHDGGHARHRRRNAVRDEEHDLQAHALALESLCLRRQAERYVLAIEHGAAVPDERLRAVTRAFRAYRPFVFPEDRRLNDAATRRLSEVATVAGSRREVATQDVSVA